MMLMATGLSHNSSMMVSKSGMAILEKHVIIENDTNLAAGVFISLAISLKVDLNSLLPTDLMTLENTKRQKFKEVTSKKLLLNNIPCFKPSKLS